MLARKTQNGYAAQAAIRCELTDSDIASALGIEIHSGSPVLALCRALVERGHDPGNLMICWRGDVESLRIRSIGEAAGLEINGHGNGFKPWHDGGQASPMRLNGRG